MNHVDYILNEHLITKSFLELENIQKSDLSVNKIERILRNEITEVFDDGLRISKFYCGDRNDLKYGTEKAIIYFKHGNFEYSFGTSEDLCIRNFAFNNNCDHRLYYSRRVNCESNYKYEDEINYVFRKLEIQSIEKAYEICKFIFLNELKENKEFQLETTLEQIKNSNSISVNDSCCTSAIQFLKEELKNRVNAKYFESHNRAIKRVEFLEKDIVQIKLDVLLIECISQYRLGFGDYIFKKAFEKKVIEKRI